MSARERLHRIVAPVANTLASLRRRHLRSRAAVDSLPWPHPRPATDPRVVWLNVGFIYLCLMQILLGPPANTVQARAWDDYLATAAYSLLMITCSVLVLVAGWCKSQYESFGYEMAGTLGYSLTFLLYTVSVIKTIDNWWATSVFTVGFALFVGNGIRAARLIGRLL